MSKNNFKVTGIDEMMKAIDNLKPEKITLEHLKKNGFDFECPECGTKFVIHSLSETCPNCKKIIDIKLEVN